MLPKEAQGQDEQGFEQPGLEEETLSMAGV